MKRAIIIILLFFLSSCSYKKHGVKDTNLDYNKGVSEIDKTLLKRLLNDEIDVVTGINTQYERRFKFNEDLYRRGTNVEEYLPTLDYYIIDINQDGINEIGVANRMYRYHDDIDVLEVIHDTDGYKYYGRGKIIYYTSSAGSTQYNYILIDTDYNTVINMQFMVVYWTGTTEYEYYINDVLVSQDQWERLREPFISWDIESPVSYSYDDVMS